VFSSPQQKGEETPFLDHRSFPIIKKGILQKQVNLKDRSKQTLQVEN
jgi:hypothetical protein